MTGYHLPQTPNLTREKVDHAFTPVDFSRRNLNQTSIFGIQYLCRLKSHSCASTDLNQAIKACHVTIFILRHHEFSLAFIQNMRPFMVVLNFFDPSYYFTGILLFTLFQCLWLVLCYNLCYVTTWKLHYCNLICLTRFSKGQYCCAHLHHISIVNG